MADDDWPNTEVSYLYRDASNYKQSASVVMAGRLSAQEMVDLLASLDERQFFIPSQVGLEDLQENFGSRLYDDDHVWHEIGAEDFEPTFRPPEVDFDIHEFVRRMIAAEWDEQKAMAEHGLDVMEKQTEYAGLPAPAREVVDHVLSELHTAHDNGQVDDENGFAADVVARLIRTYPRVIATARAAIADAEEAP